MKWVCSAFKKLWELLREVSGENDYARYRACALKRGEHPLGPRDFYLLKIQHEYCRPSRCC